MNEEQLMNVMEKVLTLNVNANTNVDIQGIVEKYMLYATVTKVGNTFLVCGTFLLFLWFVYKAVKFVAVTNVQESKEAEQRKIKEILEEFEDYDEVRNFNKKLNEILAYMPRNKRARTIEDEN